jgi:hypothetical protein
LLCRYGPVVYDLAAHFPASHFSWCIARPFAISLNDLPIDSADK